MNAKNMITIFLVSVGLVFFAIHACGEDETKQAPPGTVSAGEGPDSVMTCEACGKFNELNTAIRDGLIDKTEAAARFKAVLKELAEFAGRNDLAAELSGRCVFPLEGYPSSAMGGDKGSGYVEGGYDYFDGNAHTGHPAHDLFIRDRNRDGLDDATGKAVHVLAMDGGIVVAVETKWEKGSSLRGGRYIWIYNPADHFLTYYAHNEAVFVRLGDAVKPGDRIATVGRTGLNAYRRGSVTHLHLMHLDVKDGRSRSVDRFGVFSTCRFQ